MKEALFYKNLGGNVNCVLCPRKCIIPESQIGFCGVRQNKAGKLYSLVYAKPCSASVDPIEKKPLFHFFPGHRSFSIATVGCNLKCRHCQNWEISQAKKILGNKVEPEEIIEHAIKTGCKSISYTYTEPTVYYEYALDTAKLAKKQGILNVLVSNGFTNPEPIKQWSVYMDAVNIDIKGDARFYKEVSSAWIEPVLESVKLYKKYNVWVEITNLVIPTYNDDMKKIEEMCNWIKDNVGLDVPLHFSRFFPMYKLTDIIPTRPETLVNAREVAKKIGIHHVYIGNIDTKDGENTICPKCKEVVIERIGYNVIKNSLIKGKCPCGEKIAGVWE